MDEIPIAGDDLRRFANTVLFLGLFVPLLRVSSFFARNWGAFVGWDTGGEFHPHPTIAMNKSPASFPTESLLDCLFGKL